MAPWACGLGLEAARPLRRRRGSGFLVVTIVALFALLTKRSLDLSAPAWLEAASTAKEQIPRRQALVAGVGATTAVAPVAASAEEAVRLDQYGRAVLPDGRMTRAEGPGLDLYSGSASFLGKPKVFVAGSTGELGRRVVLDLLRTGMSVYCGIRDPGRAFEVQYQNRKSPKYEMTVVDNALIEGGREKELAEQLNDAAVVVDLAGARYGFDVLRPGVGLDSSEPARTDLNGTKALVDAAVAKGVKKFIYVSAVLVNAPALGDEVSGSSAYKDWNNFGNVLDCKRQAEEYIKKSGLDYTIIRPVPMTNDFPRDVGGLYFAKPDTLLLKDSDVGKKVSRDDVSLAVLDAVFNPTASRGTFELTGVPRRPPAARDMWWVPQDGKAS